MEEYKFQVEIVSYETDEVVETKPSRTERSADRLDDGININLDHDKYYTRIVPFKNK